jgi:cell division septum initiation protein DivIVA/nucleotide-binding universal stress UspA family protein
MMDKQNGHLFILNVHDEPTAMYAGYAAPDLLTRLAEVEDLRAKKILVHYGLKAQHIGIKFTMMKGTDSNAGELICQTIKRYNIKQVVTGRREIGEFKRFVTGSTSKYIMENAEDCNVTIVKTPVGPEFDQNRIMGEKADLITLIHQIEEVEAERKTIPERIAEGAMETKDKIVVGVTETKDRIAEGAKETKDKIVVGVTETKDRIVEGVTETKDRIVEGVTETKDKLVEGATVVREESKRVIDEARLATERATLEAKVAKDCIVDEAKHVNLEAKIGKDRMRERLVDIFAFKEEEKHTAVGEHVLKIEEGQKTKEVQIEVTKITIQNPN